MQVSITEAATLANVSRTTLYNDMNTGKITFVSNGKNKKVIDVAELERVYGSLNISDNKQTSSSVKIEQNFTKKGEDVAVPLVELAVLRERVETLEIERKRERTQFEERIEQLQETLNKSQENQNKTTLLLEHYTKEGAGGDWQKSLKALEDRIANQEAAVQEKIALEAEKTAKEAKKNEELQTQLEEKEKILAEKEEALALEKKKSFVHKLLGR